MPPIYMIVQLIVQLYYIIIYTEINMVLVCICAGHFEQILHSSGSVLKLDSTKVVKNHLIILRLHYRLH